MSRYLKLDHFVVDVLGDARSNDQQGIRKAKRKVHNRLACGSIPRKLFRKFGKELYVDLNEFENYMDGQ